MLKQITTNSLQLICCFIGKQTYCLDTFWVRSVQKADELILNKNNESPIGWLSYKEQNIAIFSLATQLKQPLREEVFNSKIILFNSKPMWGILVDRVSRVFNISRDNLFSLPNIIENSSVSAFQGVVKIKGEMFLYLAPQYLHPHSPSKQALDKQTKFNWEDLIKQVNRIQYKGQILVFSIGNNEIKNKKILLGLSITQVLQVLKSATIVPIPMSPEYILGFINWQNLPIPVVDLNLYLGLKSSFNNTDTRLLIARAATAQGVVAIVIDPLVKTLSLPIENKPIELPFLTDKAFSIKSFELRDEILVISDIDGIIEITTSLSNN